MGEDNESGSVIAPHSPATVRRKSDELGQHSIFPSVPKSPTPKRGPTPRSQMNALIAEMNALAPEAAKAAVGKKPDKIKLPPDLEAELLQTTQNLEQLEASLDELAAAFKGPGQSNQ